MERPTASARIVRGFSGICLLLESAPRFRHLGAFGLISGWIVVAKGGFPKWVGWIGVVSGVVGLAASPMLAYEGAFTPTSGLSVLPFLALTIYVVAVSVMFLRSEK